MSNFYLCDQCANCNPVIYHHDRLANRLVNCKVLPRLVTPIAAIDFGRRYVYVDGSGFEYEKPTDACMHFKRKGNR